MNNTKATIIIYLVFLYLNGCENTGRKFYNQGSVVETQTWHLPLADSLNVLKKVSSMWQLPGTGTTSFKSGYTYYKKPEALRFRDLYIETVSSTDTNNIIYYSYRENTLRMAGYTNAGTSKPLTVFDPPLIIQPADFDSVTVTNSMMKTWQNSQQKSGLDEGLKAKSIIEPLGNGDYIDANGKKQKGHLYKVTISHDKVIQYGNANLDIPDAISISSNILADEDGKLLLEWGIRSVPLSKTENKEKRPDRLYIELTKYKQIKQHP